MKPAPAPNGTSAARPPRAALFALGCRLNQAESATHADELRAAGFEVVPWGGPAELLVVNSCTVTASAAAKTRDAVRAARKRCPGAFIVLTGCDATVAAEAWAGDRAAVDLILPNAEKHALLRRLPAALLRPAAAVPAPAGGAYRNRKRATLKIQEGCDAACSYCIIPKARGAPRSRPWDEVLRETAALAARGHREIVLTGINLALYEDRGRRLPELAREILRTADGFRLRLSSLEPGPELPRIAELMAAEPRLCRHLHLPLQYADDRILAAMRRPYAFRDYAAFAHAAAAQLPGLCLGTDVIVGFPGETDDIFAASRDALAGLPLAYLHVFTFSPRPGTPAAALPGRVRGDTAALRRRDLEALGAAKAEAFVRSRVGAVVEVLAETRHADGTLAGVSGEFLEVTVAGAPPAFGVNDLVPARITAAAGGRSARAEFAG